MAGQPGLGRLSIVGTPIGNLADITLRALDCLRAVDLIACEDTRHSARLLNHYEIDTRRVSLHQHNEASRGEQLLRQIEDGAHIALITDAGMPMVSDPGQRFLHRCIAAGIVTEVIPGPSAVIAAVALSGFPADQFRFGGFLPNKSGQRASELRRALDSEPTSVYFESPHRLQKSLDLIAEAQPERLVCVAREMTKAFEEFQRGPARDVAAHYASKPPKGEITLVISGSRLPKWMRPPPEAAESLHP